MEEPGGLQSARSQSRTQPSDLTHSELGEKTAYKASRRCCGGFRKVKAKDFDVKSQELFKQDWLFSRRDATVCRDIPVAALKGQEEAGKQWCPRGSRSPWGGRAWEPLAFLHPVVLRSLVNQSLSASNNSP